MLVKVSSAVDTAESENWEVKCYWNRGLANLLLPNSQVGCPERCRLEGEVRAHAAIGDGTCVLHLERTLQTSELPSMKALGSREERTFRP